MEKQYKMTKEECEKNIQGVCEGCGGNLIAIETVDNSGDPTYWQGCEHCSSFRGGIEKKYFTIARILVESNNLLPYSHMSRVEYENTPERLEYFLDSQTAGLSYRIKEIHKKWCPFSQIAEQSREIATCCASNCMMWRREKDSYGDDYGKDTPDTIGYCGLGGRP